LTPARGPHGPIVGQFRVPQTKLQIAGKAKHT
jgi:hypothetical protein